MTRLTMKLKAGYAESEPLGLHDAYEQIRDLATSGPLEDALSQLRKIIGSDKTSARTECDLLTARLGELNNKFNRGLLIEDKKTAEENRIREQFFEFLDELETPPPSRHSIARWTRGSRGLDAHSLMQ
jgi:hypothetical protein